MTAYIFMPPSNPLPVAPGAIPGNLMLCLLLSASTLWATNAGRLQNGAATTGKPIHFSVRCRKASNLTDLPAALLKLGVLRFGVFQDGDVGIGVFPQGEEVLVSAAAFGGVAG